VYVDIWLLLPTDMMDKQSPGVTEIEIELHHYEQNGPDVV
jgi:hypothetical protein